MVELPIYAFGLQRSVRAILRVDRVSNLEGVTTSVRQATMCKRAVTLVEGGRNLAYQGMTFMFLEGAALLLESSCNIPETIQLMFLFLAIREPLFEEMLDWLQFAYIVDRTGAYVASASMVFCSVRGVGRRFSLSGDLFPPSAQLPRILSSYNLYVCPPRV